MASTTLPPITVGSVSAQTQIPQPSRSRAFADGDIGSAARYPDAKYLVVTADCGGSNGIRVGLRKRELQRFANETGLAIKMTHLPPGTSKWNRMEHRLFAFVTQNWRGKPLVSRQVIVQLIAAPRQKSASRSAVTSTPTSISRASRSPTRRWRRSKSPVTNATGSGTTQSHQTNNLFEAVIFRGALSPQSTYRRERSDCIQSI